MQIRLDRDIAEIVKRKAKAQRVKRHKSYAAVVNEALRDLFGKQQTVNVS